MVLIDFVWFVLFFAGIAAVVGKLGAGAIAGIVIAIILLVLITIDFFCCFFNKCGVIFCCHQALCGGKGSGGGGAGGKDDYMDGKASEMEKKNLPKNTEDV
ncbi:axonal fasciculation [Desmophyllum pertusum]|uniref:Axonal fasciculation n=1 Tax=Desmophyllum pertusum TaxID=174260 RepID=A0A9W9YC33_9CNID|nr:axonal fasciculation [Desmophyllum pertusum]